MSNSTAAHSAPANVFDPAIFGRGIPHEELRFLRDEHPVAWQEEHPVGPWPAGPGYWAVTRYADVRHVLASTGDYSSSIGATQIRDLHGEDLEFVRRMILNMDAPEHLRIRRLVAGAFSNRRLEQQAPTIRARARELLDAVVDDGGCDLPAQVTDDFPLLNLCDLLGVPPSDRHLLLDWTNRIIGFQDPEHGQIQLDDDGLPVNPRSPAQLADMFEYAQELAEFKRANPADDVMTALVQASVDGEQLGDAEVKMFFFLLVVAGNDTTRSALPGGVLALADNPGQYAALRGDPALLEPAIEELLRFHPPVLTFRRTAATDVELAGKEIRQGEKVVVYHISAHYDEREFDDPFSLDLTRKPNRHLAFGHGPHKCLGAHFARIQIRVFYEEMLARMGTVEVDGPVVRLTSNFINGIHHLPIRFTPGDA